LQIRYVYPVFENFSFLIPDTDPNFLKIQDPVQDPGFYRYGTGA
jgi:hypothetical protein